MLLKMKKVLRSFQIWPKRIFRETIKKTLPLLKSDDGCALKLSNGMEDFMDFSTNILHDQTKTSRLDDYHALLQETLEIVTVLSNPLFLLKPFISVSKDPLAVFSMPIGLEQPSRE